MTSLPKKTKFKMLVVDVDGTLLDSRSHLRDKTKDALLAATRCGVKVILATGRRYRRALPILRQLGIYQPIILNTGGLIKDPKDHRTVYKRPFSKETLSQVVAVVKEYGLQPIIYLDNFPEGPDFLVETAEGHPFFQEYLKSNEGFYASFSPLEEHLPEEAVEIGVFDEEEDLRRLASSLRKDLLQDVDTNLIEEVGYHLIETAESSPAGEARKVLEIFRRGATKWQAVVHLLARFGFTPDEIIAVGDDVNDIEMIKGAGLGIAVANALPQVKEAASYIVGSNDEDGVAEVVDKFLL